MVQIQNTNKSTITDMQQKGTENHYFVSFDSVHI